MSTKMMEKLKAARALNLEAKKLINEVKEMCDEEKYPVQGAHLVTGAKYHSRMAVEEIETFISSNRDKL